MEIWLDKIYIGLDKLHLGYDWKRSEYYIAKIGIRIILYSWLVGAHCTVEVWNIRGHASDDNQVESSMLVV